MDTAWVEATLDGIGRYGKAERGYSRLVFSEAEWAACEYVAGLMREAGLAVRTDAFGNLIGRLEGADPAASVAATGSHLDSVPEGGNFDGVAGVVAGLAAVRHLKARGRLRHPVELIIFRGEESSRFSIHTMGSKVMAGLAGVEAWRKVEDLGGITLAQALAARGLDLEKLPQAARRPEEFKAFVELHIEQGPVLEREGLPIGIVEAIAAPTRLRLAVTGMAGHSGTTPMAHRQDALASAARMVLAVREAARRQAARGTVGTVGVLRVHPGALNVIPGLAELWVDVRGVDHASVTAGVDELRQAVTAIAEEERTPVAVEVLSSEVPVRMAGPVIETIERACRTVGAAARRMASGAGHDAMNMARLAPAGMIFIPCRQGISHNPAEYAAPEDILTGITVLTETLASMAA